MKTIQAEISGIISNDRFIGDITAECPRCMQLDAFLSTGEHRKKGNDTVKCTNCNHEFKIEWDATNI